MTPDLSLTQVLVFEIDPRCNLASTHCRWCPSGDPDRYGDLDTSRPITDALVMSTIQEAVEFGFRGEVAFHYYNEPMLSWPRIRALIPQIKSGWPAARFCLFTNGTQLPPDLAELAVFDDVWVSNYLGLDWQEILGPHVPRLHVLPGTLDDRKHPLGEPSGQPCLRPFQELIIDAYGNGHLCCSDWRGVVPLGNLWDSGLPPIAAEYLRLRDLVSHAPLGPGAPTICRHCSIRQPDVGHIVREIADDTRHHLGLEE